MPVGAKTVAVLETDADTAGLSALGDALHHAGATVTTTREPSTAIAADGLVIASHSQYPDVMDGLRAVQGPRIIGQRLAGSRPVLAIGSGMHVLFDECNYYRADGSERVPGCGEWPGMVEELHSAILSEPQEAEVSGSEINTGFSSVDVPSFARGGLSNSQMFAGVDTTARFYFAHSYAIKRWELEPEVLIPPIVAYANFTTERFVAAVENGALWATQFHPEHSADAGLRVLRNWVRTL